MIPRLFLVLLFVFVTIVFFVVKSEILFLIKKVIDSQLHPGNTYTYTLKVKDADENHQSQQTVIIY